MKYSLKTNYRGRFHSMPNILLDFLPSDEYMTFAQIYVSGRKPLCDDKIVISQRNLVQRTGMGRRSLTKALNNLQRLNFIRLIADERKTSTFQINWEEINAIEEFAKNLSYEGVAVLSNECFTDPVCPFSELSNKQLKKIESQYPHEFEDWKHNLSELEEEETSPVSILQKTDEMVADEISKETPTATILQKMAQMYTDEISSDSATVYILTKSAKMYTDEKNQENKSVYNLNKSDEMYTDAYTAMYTDELVPCNFASHSFVKTPKGIAVNILLSHTEALLVDVVGAENIGLIFKKCQNVHSLQPQDTPSVYNLNKSAKMYTDEKSRLNPSVYISTKNAQMYTDEKSAVYISDQNEEKSVQNVHTVNINNINNKYNHSELRSLNKGGKENFEIKPEGEEEVLEQDELVQTSSDSFNKKPWVEFRDLSYPSFSAREFELIINNPELYTSDSEKIIQQVWNNIQLTEHENFEDEVFEEKEQDNIVPVDHFQKILFNVWSDLKEADSNFNLTEQQAKDIFGFDVVDLGDEYGYVISSSKIKNINQTDDAPISSKRSKNKRKPSRNDRKVFLAFKDCLDKVSYKSVDALTPAEYVIVCIDELAQTQKDKGIPRPDTIAKGIFSDYLKEWSEQAGMSLEDITDLVSELPVKGNMVTLRPQRISVDKIFEHNHQHGFKSEVEPLWKTCMEQSAERDERKDDQVLAEGTENFDSLSVISQDGN